MGGAASTSLKRCLGTIREEVRILIVGLDAAGKTTALYQLKLGENVTTIPTIGFNVETIEYRHLSFTAWDVGGRGNARALWRHYYQNTRAIILVVDSNDRDRIDDVREHAALMLGEDELRDAILLVYANKQDLPNAMTAADVTEKLDLHKLRIQWYVQAACATTGEGLYEGLDWLSRTLSARSRKEDGALAQAKSMLCKFAGAGLYEGFSWLQSMPKHENPKPESVFKETKSLLYISPSASEATFKDAESLLSESPSISEETFK